MSVALWNTLVKDRDVLGSKCTLVYTSRVKNKCTTIGSEERKDDGQEQFHIAGCF